MSLPAGHLMSKTGAARALKSYLDHMANIEANVRFMSIEPLWFDIAPVLRNWLQVHDQLPFEWAIIGAASNGSKIYQPETYWTQSLLDLFDELKIPVFFKGNMNWNDEDWREDFPTNKSNIQLELI